MFFGGSRTGSPPSPPPLLIRLRPSASPTLPALVGSRCRLLGPLYSTTLSILDKDVEVDQAIVGDSIVDVS